MNRTQWSRLLPALSVALAAACDRRTDAVTISGTVEIREIRMAALASGRLDRLLKDEGDSVRRGDTIAVLVQPGLDAQIEERQARSQAAVERLSEVDAARADSERAAGDLARATPLRANGIVAAQQYDNLRSAATAASARLQSVRAAVGEASAARAAVQATRAIRDQLTVIAPDDGVILTRYAERGEAVASGAPIVSLGVVGRPWIRAYIGERVLPRVMVGQAVR